MRAYGSSTTSVGGTTSVPLPPAPAKIGRRVQLVECKCGHRGRPGAFHICIDLSTPEPKAKPAPRPKREAQPRVKRAALPKPKREPKPTVEREAALCANECGATVYKAGNSCRACSAAARTKPKPVREPRPEREVPVCRNECGRTVAKAGTQCRPCYHASIAAAPKAHVGRGQGGGRGNKGGTVNARIDEIIERYAAGESIKALAADVGVTTNGIRLGLKRRGVTLRSSAEEHRGPHPDRRALTPEQVAVAVARYEMGASVVGIAERLGAAETTVRNALRRSGVKLRGNRGRGAA